MDRDRAACRDPVGALFWLGSRIDALAARLDGRIDGLGARLDRRLDSVDGRIDAMSARFDDAVNGLARIEANLELQLQHHAG